jgi:hypothetical protein
MWVHLILILKKSKIWNNHEQIKVQMNLKNIYIHKKKVVHLFCSNGLWNQGHNDTRKTIKFATQLVNWDFFVRNDIFKILKV